MTTPRWGRCIYHLGQDTEEFLGDYLTESHRQVLLIAGAGFDPRSTAVARLVAQYAEGRARGYFLREERPRPDAALFARGDQNEAALRHLLPDCSVTSCRTAPFPDSTFSRPTTRSSGGGRLSASSVPSLSTA